MQCDYTFKHDETLLCSGLEHGYLFQTCYAYYTNRQQDGLRCILRHDVDTSPERCIEFARLESKLGIQATYFFRIHANEYNCLGYETIALIKDIHHMGHEIGLHAEPIDVHSAQQD